MTWFTMKDRIGYDGSSSTCLTAGRYFRGSARNAATLSSVSALTCGPKSLIRAMERTSGRYERTLARGSLRWLRKAIFLISAIEVSRYV